MASNPMKAKMAQMHEAYQYLQKRYPTETQAFSHFFKETESGPALSMREKELINVALAVAGQCDWCIGSHVRSAIHAGASRDEIVEAGFMAVIMHGGPALMYLTSLVQALDLYLPENENPS
ncbi:MAG: carboxymuconolactone decarboxylase family protein [Methylohalobius sp. ZOD2]|nr:carboxymuconolactone decarboxylase family protein [Methylothermaceae bacterium]